MKTLGRWALTIVVFNIVFLVWNTTLLTLFF